jgi:hypothetical protein
VIDTTGSRAFGDLVHAGRAHAAPLAGWSWQSVVPSAFGREPMYESINQMSPMTYWELQGVVSFLLSEVEPHPQLPKVVQAANEFVLSWRTLWFGYGADPTKLQEYQHLLIGFLTQMRRSAVGMQLKNQAPLTDAFVGLLSQAARVDSGESSDG